jgi:hypothetical protein
MSQVCVICSAKNRRAIEAALMNGVADREVSRQFQIPKSSVQRHRQIHLIKPAQDRLAILDKDFALRQERREREELAQAAASDEPPIDQLIQAATGTRALIKRLDSIDARLERMNVRAEDEGSPNGVAALSGQQLRGLEFRAKMGSHPGFVPARSIDGGIEATKFEVNIILGDKVVTVATHSTGSPTVEGNADWDMRARWMAGSDTGSTTEDNTSLPS